MIGQRHLGKVCLDKIKKDLNILLFTWICQLLFLFLRKKNPAIYKTRNTGTRNGMRGMRGTRRMFTGIPGNPLEDSGECYYFNIPGNVQTDSGECSKRFRGMFKKIPGNVRKDSGECSKRFRGMFKKIPGNVQKDSGEESRVTA